MYCNFWEPDYMPATIDATHVTNNWSIPKTLDSYIERCEDSSSRWWYISRIKILSDLDKKLKKPS